MTKFENASPADELRPDDRHGQVEAKPSDEHTMRMIFEGVAWVVGYAVVRRICSGVDSALAEADKVADAFAARFGDGDEP